MMRARGLPTAVLVTLGLLATGLVFAPASALAAEGWGVTSTFGSPGAGAGQLKEPDGIAVSESGATSGDVYAVDKGNNRVEYFSATGTFAHQFNGQEIDGSPAGAGHEAPAKLSEPQYIAIDNSAGPSKGDVYVSDHGNGVIDKFSASGEYISQLGPLSNPVLGIAVDGAGDVWVSEENNQEVSEYSEAGKLEKHFPIARSTHPGLAVDSGETVYQVVGGESVVEKYNPATGAEDSEEFASHVSALTIDSANEEVYVDEGTSLVQYGPFGKPFSKPVHLSGAHLVASSAGVAVDSTTGALYLADSTGDDVAILGLGSEPAAPATKAPSAITTTTATLNGEVTLSPTENTEYWFDYDIGSECSGFGGSSTTHVSAGTGSGGKVVSTPVANLQPNQSYSVCLVVENKFGPTTGTAEPLQTKAAPPAVFGEGVSAVTPYSARLEGLVNPNNELITTCKIEYGRTIAYGNTLPCEGAPEPFEGFNEGGDAVGANVAVLAADTTYHFRIVATNATGTTEGTGEFTTATLQEPGVGGEGSEEVTPFAAKLHAEVNPNYQETTCVFEYGTEPLLKTGVTTVACPASLGSGGAPVGPSVGPNGEPQGPSIALSALTAKTTYYYRVVATNGSGTQAGSIETLETLAVEPPTFFIEETKSVTPTSASVLAYVYPDYQETTCEVQYVDEASYKTSGYADALKTGCDPENLGHSGTELAVPTATLTGLAPNTTYHYRVIATNASGNSQEGAGETFLTLPDPPTLNTGEASEMTTTSATISGSVNPRADGFPAQDETTYYFQYGTSAGYGSQIPLIEGNVGQGTSAVRETAALTGLEPDTTYHYRIVASNDNHSGEGGARQTAYGADVTFATAAAPPTLGDISASSVTESATPAPGAASSFPPSTPLLAIPNIKFPEEEAAGTSSTPKKLSNAQKLKNALKACRAKRAKQRAGCERLAHKKYSAAKKRKK